MGALSCRQGVNYREGERSIQENMDLFILLFTVYLIVTLTRLKCMSATGLRFVFFLDLCKSLQNGCVYLFLERVALNTCVSEMRLIKFDE